MFEIIEHLPTRQPVISSGPNAGKPRPHSDITIDLLREMLTALLAMKRDGYDIRKAEVDAWRLQARITVAPNHVTAKEVAAGRALWVKLWTCKAGVRRARYQLTVGPVLIEWCQAMPVGAP
jgi:hypothetical protein